MFTLPTIPHPITLHYLSSDKSENRFGLMQQICTPLSKLIFSDMSRKEQILRPKTDSVSIQRTQNQHAWGNVELISAPSYIETPHSIRLKLSSSPPQPGVILSTQSDLSFHALHHNQALSSLHSIRLKLSCSSPQPGVILSPLNQT